MSIRGPEPPCTLVEAIMWLSLLVGCSLALFSMQGCALPSPAVEDRPCEFHKHNPSSNFILLQLTEQCNLGVVAACELLAEINDAKK